MGVKERREREKLETRDLILEAARELFVSEGYDRVSMRKVAEKIEYSPTAIYVHFADKEALFRELCHRDFDRLGQVFRRAALPDDPAERLKHIGRTYVEFGRQYPNHYRLMFMTPHPPSELDDHDCQIRGNPEMDAYALLKHTVQQAIDAGVFRAGINDAELISQTLWSAAHGVISLHIAKQFDSWVEWRSLDERVSLILDAVLNGLRTEA
jgi:AcrR family transcriptional regulator